MIDPPFPVTDQLDGELRLDQSKIPAVLCSLKPSCTSLPGQPRVQLSSTELDNYLRTHLLVPELDRLAPKLWLVSTPRSSHVSPLHHQAVRGRTIVLTENPQLHLVWYYDKIFLKPIPRYLMSQAFWQYLATRPANMREAAIGFMRTYCHLVHHETDYRIALEKGLIPNDASTGGGNNPISWDAFAKLIASFDGFDDSSVSPRYQYGELRLSRLNFYSRIFLRKLTFHHIEAQWGQFVGSAVAPFIIMFAILAVILNAMQVELAVQAQGSTKSSWITFANVSKWVAVLILVFVMLVILFITVLVATLFFHDIWFARSIIHDKKTSRDTS